MILLVDNQDSYTYNLFQLIARIAGQEPHVILAEDVATSGTLEALSAGYYTHVVISPGPGSPENPQDFEGSRLVIEASAGLPVLGVCLGHQGLALLAGGGVGRAPSPIHGYLSQVRHSGKGIFADIPQGFSVVRYHSLAVCEPLPDKVHVHARADDGVIMGLHIDGTAHWGVQFHPESVLSEAGEQLIRNFLSLAQLRAQKASGEVPVNTDRKMLLQLELPQLPQSTEAALLTAVPKPDQQKKTLHQKTASASKPVSESRLSSASQTTPESAHPSKFSPLHGRPIFPSSQQASMPALGQQPVLAPAHQLNPAPAHQHPPLQRMQQDESQQNISSSQQGKGSIYDKDCHARHPSENSYHLHESTVNIALDLPATLEILRERYGVVMAIDRPGPQGPLTTIGVLAGPLSELVTYRVGEQHVKIMHEDGQIFRAPGDILHYLDSQLRSWAEILHADAPFDTSNHASDTQGNPSNIRGTTFKSTPQSVNPPETTSRTTRQSSDACAAETTFTQDRADGIPQGSPDASQPHDCLAYPTDSATPVYSTDFSTPAHPADSSSCPYPAPVQESVSTPECGFTGGYLGFFGYGITALTVGLGTGHPTQPDAAWLRPQYWLTYDHSQQLATLAYLSDNNCAQVHPLADMLVPTSSADLLFPDERPSNLLSSHEKFAHPASAGKRPAHPVSFEERKPRKTEPQLPISPTPSSWQHPCAGSCSTDVGHWSVSDEEYLHRIRLAQDELKAGESYEICLTDTYSFTSSVRGHDYLRALRSLNPAQYAAYIAIDCEELEVICSSPELFLQLETDGTLTTKPIKGTTARKPNPHDDAHAAHILASDPKTRAENLMIVDLLRNDLGRVCEIGSVHVPSLMHVESAPTVHSLVTTVRGMTRPGLGIIDVVRAAFPGGSMTGAPKYRTLEIIEKLEGVHRGIYSGTIGHLGFDGGATLNIVIRTAVRQGNSWSVGAGGAIVLASDPEAELAERNLKASAILRAHELAQPRLDEQPRLHENTQPHLDECTHVARETIAAPSSSTPGIFLASSSFPAPTEETYLPSCTHTPEENQ